MGKEDKTPVEELGLAPSKSTGALVPDTQTGVLTLATAAPDDQKKTGKVTVTLEGATAEDGKSQKFEFDFFDGGDLAGTFNAVKSALDNEADKAQRKAASKAGRANAGTTGVTDDNAGNTQESKGRGGEQFATDFDKSAAELKAQNEAKASPNAAAKKAAADEAAAKKAAAEKAAEANKPNK